MNKKSGYLSDLYLGAIGDDGIYKIVKDAPIKIVSQSVNLQPRQVCIDGNGVVWVANYLQNTVLKIVNDIVVQVISFGASNNPSGICADKYNNIWVCNETSGYVYKIVNGVVVATITAGTNPEGICADLSGNIWVVNQGSNNVTRIAPDLSTSSISGYFNMPNAVCCDMNNVIWVANYNSTVIVKITNGAVETTFNVTGGSPYACCIDKNNAVYVATYSQGLFKIVGNTITRLVDSFVLSVIDGGVFVNKYNDIYVPVQGAYVVKISGGAIVKNIALPTNRCSCAGDATGMQWHLLFAKSSRTDFRIHLPTQSISQALGVR